MSGDSGLRLEAHGVDGRVESVAVCKPGPQAARMPLGRPVDEALQLAPAMFGPWGRAHGLAATAACAAAAAPGVARAEGWAEERALAAEIAQEHLRRLMLDWPGLFGHPQRRDRFAILHRRLANLGDARAAFDLGGEILDLVAVELLGGFFRATREPCGLREFVERARRGGSIGAALADIIEMGSSTPEHESVPLLPPCSAAAWAHEFGGLPADEFCAEPTFGGRAHETGVLARHAGSMLVGGLLAQGHRIAARLFARVIDLADCASRLRHPLATDMPPLIDAAPLGEAAGLACVETASGLLMHAVRIEEGRIAGYAVVAPTEWNFHPQGPFVREGAGWTAPSREVALLRLKALALALDPGVEYEIVFEAGADA
jgi:hypothetical protein